MAFIRAEDSGVVDRSMDFRTLPEMSTRKDTSEKYCT